MAAQILWRVFLLVGLLCAAPLAAQDRAAEIRQKYVKSEHAVPMRDGVKLYTIIYKPRDTSRTYPFLMMRTPYSIAPYGEGYRSSLGPSRKFEDDGYIFVYQDVRGQFKSEGDFVVMRPIAPRDRSGVAVDESTDAHDTIEWLLGNIAHGNGRVGQWGISYPGTQTVWGLVNHHPALVAASPQAPAIDMFLGDDFHHNGAFRLMYTFHWLMHNAATRGAPTDQRRPAFNYGTPDSYRFFLEAGTLAELTAQHLQDRVPTWNEYQQHPDYDEYWERQNTLKHLTNVKAAVLNVGGWFDAEDFYGPIETYKAIETQNPENRNRIVIGPWLHGGWATMSGDSLGDIRFGSKTGEHYRDNVEFPFFRRHLKEDAALRELPEATVFETGGNQWREFAQWPPAESVEQKLYLHPKRGVSFQTPEQAGEDRYLSDPAKPVPFSAEVRNVQGHLWMVEDQRFASRRPDVLTYESEPLTEDVTIAGPILANLWVASTGTDTDFVVKLIDVYPPDAPDNTPNPREVKMGHFEMLLAGEVFRARYRNSFAKPEPLVPGEPAKIVFDLRDRFHRFQKGHRIMVQIQSSWFPVIDRNPQTFVNIYQARPEDFQRAEQTVFTGGDKPSHLSVRVLK